MGDCSFDPCLCCKEGLSQHRLQIPGWMLLVLGCFIIMTCLWICQLLVLRALHLSLPPKAPLWCHTAPPALHSWLLKFTVKSQQDKYLMCVLCVFIAALCSPLFPAASGQCGTKFTNLYGDLLRAPDLLHSAELTTCEQTEEAAALGGKSNIFSYTFVVCWLQLH